MREAVVQWLDACGLSPELVVFVIAMLPIVELRGAVPVGINICHLVWYKTFIIALLGNLAPVPFLLLFLDRVAKFLSRLKVFARFFDWLFTRTRKKSKVIEEYKFWGLVIFVAIPLPGTGAWTGTLAAFLLGMDFKRSLLAIALGVLFAGVLVMGLSLLGIWGALIAGTALVTLTTVRIIRRYASLRQPGNWKGPP